MGYFQDEYPEHEGYAVGYVYREGCAGDTRLVRELLYPTDNASRGDVVLISAGCDCGWTSPYFKPRTGRVEWSPFTVHTSEEDDDRVVALWREHLLRDCEPHTSSD